MKNCPFIEHIEKTSEIKENKAIFKAKEDSNQAQVLRGWYAPTYTHPDYPKIVVMNNILGSSGLSSRLFVELRDKKGLAYTVRSSYESMLRGAILYFYIGCDPANIKNSLDSFDYEVSRLKNTPVSDEELEGAKENILGRLEYFSQTNIQQATLYSIDYITGLGLDWEEKYKQMIIDIDKKDIQEATKYFLDNHITSIVAPNKYSNWDK